MPIDLRGAALHFDCAAGIAGDMTVGALVDLGVPSSVVEQALAALPLSGYRVRFARVKRGALMGTKFRVDIDAVPAPSPQPAEKHHHHHDEHRHDHAHEHHVHDLHGAHAHRHYADIRALLERAGISDAIRLRALSIFDRIAAVEARLHGVTVDEVAFHEVGAIDSIVDIVGAAAALDWLNPSQVTSRVVALGHGSVQTAHGLLPIPAPATLELLVGAKVEDGGLPFELTTPTGAAILASTVAAPGGYGPLPSLRVLGVGWGAGDRDLPDRPNFLRVIAGTPEAAPDAENDSESEGAVGTRCVVLEANVDDMTPEQVAPLIADLIEAGARDAWVSSVLMKKGRPGFVVAVLCDGAKRPLIEAALLRGSTTIGVRRHDVLRTVLPRRIVEVTTPFGSVTVKVAGEGEGENAAPEYEVCRRLSVEQNVPLKRVYAEALAAFYRR